MGNYRQLQAFSQAVSLRKAAGNTGDQMVVYGVCSGAFEDVDNDIVDPKAVTEAIPLYMAPRGQGQIVGGPMLYHHQEKQLPIGRVRKLWIQNGLTHFEAVLDPANEFAVKLYKQIKSRIVHFGVSLGGEIQDWVMRKLGGKLVRWITKIRLDEISITPNEAGRSTKPFKGIWSTYVLAKSAGESWVDQLAPVRAGNQVIWLDRKGHILTERQVLQLRKASGGQLGLFDDDPQLGLFGEMDTAPAPKRQSRKERQQAQLEAYQQRMAEHRIELEPEDTPANPDWDEDSINRDEQGQFATHESRAADSVAAEHADIDRDIDMAPAGDLDEHAQAAGWTDAAHAAKAIGYAQLLQDHYPSLSPEQQSKASQLIDAVDSALAQLPDSAAQALREQAAASRPDAASAPQSPPQETVADAEPAKASDSFSIERPVRDEQGAITMETQTFNKDDRVRAFFKADKLPHGRIVGISQAKQQVRWAGDDFPEGSEGIWLPFSAIYHEDYVAAHERSHTEPATAAPATPERNPWEMSASGWLAHTGVHEPWIGEISPMQMGLMGKQQKARYDKQRAAEWDASSKAKAEWRAAVIAAHDEGRITQDDPGLHPDAKSAIFAERAARQEAAEKARLDQALKDNRITSASQVKAGDRVYDVMYGRYVTVTKPLKASVHVVDDHGDTYKAPASRLQWRHYNEVKSGQPAPPAPESVTASIKAGPAKPKPGVDRPELFVRPLKIGDRVVDDKHTLHLDVPGGDMVELAYHRRGSDEAYKSAAAYGKYMDDLAGRTTTELQMELQTLHDAEAKYHRLRRRMNNRTADWEKTNTQMQNLGKRIAKGDAWGQRYIPEAIHERQQIVQAMIGHQTRAFALTKNAGAMMPGYYIDDSGSLAGF